MTHPRSIRLARQRCTHASRAARFGFTLTELIVAVVILVIVILATSKIFGTASKVTGQGQALASMIQEVNAIERQMRDDIARLSYDGFFAIRNVAVANDVNGAVLVNPNLPPDTVIRADQLVFFTEGPQTIQTIRTKQGDNQKGQSAISRVYYGHSFQLPSALGANTSGLPDTILTHDPRYAAGDATITPWYSSTTPHNMVWTRFQGAHDDPPGDYVTTNAPESVNATQPPANRWLLLRQSVLLADDDLEAADDDAKVVFLDSFREAYSILPRFPGNFSGGPGSAAQHFVVLNGRVDACAQQLGDLRSNVTLVSPTTGVARPWLNPAFPLPGDQRTILASSIFYPRAERYAPSSNRMDEALTNNVIAGACSSFIVEWTFADQSSVKREPTANNVEADGIGYGEFDNIPGVGTNDYLGVRFNPALEHPWFGLNDFALGNSYSSMNRGVSPYCAPGNHPANLNIVAYTPAVTNSYNNGTAATSTYPGTFEFSQTSTAYIQDYYAVFGYNQSQPLDTSFSPPVLFQTTPPASQNNAYTPWPSAIRVTMTLHDPENRIESGRDFQFVIDLPRRSR
ncbi:MAG TPA: prepilin-type N-terminal cleavage/methylation domain-containing protein [Phycisphaerales bacterium]|nr:prepilin-type N-terminal cleavage/methylation domain-containing protein [Phycisphaerales bacterium]